MNQSNNMVWSDARQYAKNGIYTAPVYVTRKPDGKKDVRPVGRWRETSSISLADIAAWEEEHPHAGLLIDCGKSNLVVVDCDGEEGVRNWLALDPPRPIDIVLTAGGGQHWYYRAHPDHVIGNDQSGKVAPKVDIRGLGGFVIAPPTTDGVGTWMSTFEYPLDWEQAAIVPHIVIDRMTARPAAHTPAGELTGDHLFDGRERAFTREQAWTFIDRATARLAETTDGFNGAINNFAMACAHFPWMLDREACAALMIEALRPVTGWTAPDGDDLKTINSAYSATEDGKSWTATEVTATAVPQPAAPDIPDLEINGAAGLAYWLQDNLGTGPMSGFFLRDGAIVHTPRVGELGYVAPRADGDDNGPAEIRPVTDGQLAAKLQYLYRCWKWHEIKDHAGKKTGEKIQTPALFPRPAASVAVSAPEAMLALRPLRGITGTPMIRQDGSLLDAPGYDAQSGYVFLPAPGVDVPEVPERPSNDEVNTASHLLLDMIQDFPFATDDDRANYLGLLLTPMLRQVAPPSYKMFGIGAHQPGSGKSLLAEIAATIHGAVFRSEVPDDEAEWRKATSSILATTSAPVVVLDNVTGILKSSVLAGLLTSSGEIQERELGKSSNLTFTNDRVWVITGNNLSIGGDLVRRTITILIDPDSPNPEHRMDFAIRDLSGWVADNRNRILWSLLVLIRAWVAEGMPEPERKQSDSFARWERVVAGVLSVAGILGSFDAESGKRVAAGGDDDGLATVLEVLRERHGEGSFSVAEALKAEKADWLIESRDWVPAPVLDKLSKSEAAGRTALGWWFRNRIGRWVTGSDGRAYVIREAGKERHVVRWRVEVR